jgi:enoyl-CoA hydratase
MKSDAYSNLILETFDSVLRVTLNRPERRNALSAELIDELLTVISIAGQDADTRVLILRGNGPGFCSGYDVTPTRSSATERPASPVQRLQSARTENRLVELLWQCPIPTIAQVHGHCLAGGTDLALSCDFVLCAADARVGYPAVRSMGAPASHMWLYHLGPQWTKRLLLTGDSITGAKAAELGLALEAVEPAELDTHVLNLATRMSWIPRDLLVANKYVVNRGLELMGRTLLQDTAVTQEIFGRLSPGADQFWTTARSSGVTQAIAERDAPFTAGDPIS